MKTTARIVLLTATMITLGQTAFSHAAEPSHTGIEFATINNQPLLLDIYHSSDAVKPVPLIVWVHGGAWRKGSRSSVPIVGLLKHGFSIASVDYRLSPVAKFPAQVHDIKAAIRYLKASAAEHGFDHERFFIAGASAGGHLAALVGVSENVAQLEGRIGKHVDQSSGVRGIVSFYGASNLQTILSQSTPHGLSVRVPALELLLGARPENVPALAKLASPVAHVDASDPPLLLIHGDQDPQMPINQSHELQGRYQDVKRPVELRVVHGAAHGGAAFYDQATLQEVAAFLKAAIN